MIVSSFLVLLMSREQSNRSHNQGGTMILRTTFLAVGILCVLGWTTAGAQILHPRFDSFDGLRPVGAIMPNNGVAAMTHGGRMQTAALWSEARQNVASGFSTTFTFRVGTGLVGGITHPDGTGGADGFAFVIYNGPQEAIGGSGHCLGYEGITNSIAVEFDTWMNPDCGDPNGNHISVNTRGLLFNSARHAYSLGVSSDIPNLSDGAIHSATITYSPGTLSVTVDNAPPLVVPIDLNATITLEKGQAWVGFTSATGAAWEGHDILSWSFDDNTATTGGGRRGLR